MVKLVDVARACGLSVSQTSRALNGRQDVSEETKRRVSQTAAAMGYVKNLTAQTLFCEDADATGGGGNRGSVSRRRIPPFSLALCRE